MSALLFLPVVCGQKKSYVLKCGGTFRLNVALANGDEAKERLSLEIASSGREYYP